MKGEKIMDFYKVPIGFGLAMSGNTAAMIRYSHMTEQERQDILNRAHNVRSEKEMYALVASLANGTVQ
jgi:pantoate kinase